MAFGHPHMCKLGGAPTTSSVDRLTIAMSTHMSCENHNLRCEDAGSLFLAPPPLMLRLRYGGAKCDRDEEQGRGSHRWRQTRRLGGSAAHLRTLAQQISRSFGTYFAHSRWLISRAARAFAFHASPALEILKLPEARHFVRSLLPTRPPTPPRHAHGARPANCNPPFSTSDLPKKKSPPEARPFP